VLKKRKRKDIDINLESVNGEAILGDDILLAPASDSLFIKNIDAHVIIQGIQGEMPLPKGRVAEINVGEIIKYNGFLFKVV